MPVSIIPFKMPEPAEIPAHIIDALKEMPADEAVVKSMDLLMQIEAAETLVYERVNEKGQIQLMHVAGRRADELNAALSAGSGSFAEAAIAQSSALLIMGQASAVEASALPSGAVEFLLAGAESGSIGFNYVLLFTGADDKALGALTLMRAAEDGPLNHEQPNICEAMRREISLILAV
ncbi:MAG: hypothetical protein ACI906_002701 [Candidatus Latescibacterota bacterium]|jgi:hypothetical protein